MTAIHSHPVRSRGSAEHPLPRALALTWDVLPDAPGVGRIVRAATAPAQGRLLLVIEHHATHVYLETRSTPDAAWERSPASSASIPASVHALDAEHRLYEVHVPGVIHATLALAGPCEPRLLYAKTPLLPTLGFPPGSYDRPNAAWHKG